MFGHVQARLVAPVDHEDHTRGPDDAPLTLVEYGDFECPYCGLVEPIISRLVREFGGSLRFAFREFPLIDSHPHAYVAAEAAEAAGAQGKFWEMHDALYAHQRALDPQSLLSYADELGLDVSRLGNALEDDMYAARIQRDLESGEESGVPGTPSFFINGEFYEGPPAYEAMREAVVRAGGHATQG